MFPSEIWQHIINNVEDLRALFHIRRVCKAWKVYVSKVTVIDQLDEEARNISTFFPRLKHVRQPYSTFKISDAPTSLVNAYFIILKDEWFNVLEFLRRSDKMKQIEYMCFDRSIYGRSKLEITPIKLTFNWSTVPHACAVQIITEYVYSVMPKINIEVDNYIWDTLWDGKVNSFHHHTPNNQAPRHVYQTSTTRPTISVFTLDH